MPSPTLSKVQEMSNGFTSQAGQDHADGEKSPVKAKFKKSGARGIGKNDEHDEEEEIGVHMWEKCGKLVMEVPWFRTEGQA